ncbi:hypothetical protein GCM10023318_31090 [Nocardia callitridis]|uniref:PH domain-containing protein n=1 Tax=Nocardia callitridis TaxID=648753 RepID=A0ABP9KFL2_9NOCA
MGLIGIAVGLLLLVTTTTDSPLTFPVVAPIAVGIAALLLGLRHIIRPVPDLTVDDNGVTFSPFGRIPWAVISRIHLITAHGMRYLAVELVDSNPRLAESRWSRWIYSPVGKITVGFPLTISERWLRPISLDDIVAELHRRNPDLVIARSERKAFRRAQPGPTDIV